MAEARIRNIPSDDWLALRIEAVKRKISVNELVLRLIKEYADKIKLKTE